MSSGVNPAGGGYPYYQPIEPSEIQKVIMEMQNFEEELRAAMGPPPDTAKVDKLLPAMENFLNKHKETIAQLIAQKNFPDGAAFGFAAEFGSAISAIQTYLEHPTYSNGQPNNASLDMLNESITQLNWDITNAYTPHSIPIIRKPPP